MAFTSRAKRDPSFLQSRTPNTVGPGSYDVARASAGLKVDTRRSAAPFGSTTARRFHTDTTASLGPGAYNIATEIGKSRSTNAPAPAFMSSSQRFRYKAGDDDGPGPAAYVPPPLVAAPIKRRPQPLPRVRQKPKSFSSPPSIPVPRQSYGYEEGPDRSLRPHMMPEPDTTGGPAFYSPTDNPLKTNVKGYVSMGRDRSRRSDFAPRKTTDLPGPGAYTLRDGIGYESLQARTARRTSAVFASRSRRTEFNRGAFDLPGPGEYNTHRSDLVKKSYNVTIG